MAETTLPVPYERYAEVKSALDRALRENERLRRKRVELEEAVRQAVTDNVLTLEFGPVERPKADRRKRGEEVAVAWFSDWQLGKVTSSYDTGKCVERVHRYLDKVQRITDIQRADHPVKRCSLWVTGDMVENETTFPSQPHLIDSSLFRQLTTCSKLMTDVCRRLEGMFESVSVHAVDGNHGWVAGGPRRGMNPETNMDRLVYHMTADLLRESGSKVRWHIPDPHNERAWYHVVRIGRYRCLLFHGDQIRGGFGGFPWYGFGKKVQGWRNGVIPEPFQDAACGHWHQPTRFTLNRLTVRVSGSTESDNQYAQENLAAAGTPSQWLLYVDPDDSRVTAEYCVDLS